MRCSEYIEYRGVEFKIEYNFYKGNPGTLYHSDMSGTPPEPDEVEILHIWFGNNQYRTDFYQVLEDNLEEIEEEILKLHE